MSWTSTWRAEPTRRSMSTLGSPKACSAAAPAPVAVDDGRGSQAVPFVGLADEERVALRLGVEGDDVDGVRALLVELANRVDRAHRRFAAVDDRQALERTLVVRHAGRSS